MHTKYYLTEWWSSNYTRSCKQSFSIKTKLKFVNILIHLKLSSVGILNVWLVLTTLASVKINELKHLISKQQCNNLMTCWNTYMDIYTLQLYPECMHTTVVPIIFVPCMQLQNAETLNCSIKLVECKSGIIVLLGFSK